MHLRLRTYVDCTAVVGGGWWVVEGDCPALSVCVSAALQQSYYLKIGSSDHVATVVAIAVKKTY